MALESGRGMSAAQGPDAARIASPGRKRRRRRLASLLGWLLTVTLLAGIFRWVPVHDVWQAARRADPLFLTLAMATTVVSLLLRGARWALLFQPRYRVGSGEALGPALVGLGLNAVLPAKAGEVAKIMIATRRFGAGIAFTTSTVVVERLLDAAALLILLTTSLLTLPPVEAPVAAEVLGYSLRSETLELLTRRLGFGILLAAVLALGLSSPPGRRLLRRAIGRLPESRIRRRAERTLSDFGLGLTALRRPAILLRAAFATLLIWLATSLSNLLASMAIPGIELDFRQALVLTAVATAVSALPSAPGAWGVFEAGVLLALALTRIHPAAGAGVTLAFACHLCQYLPVVVLGGIAGLRR